MWVHNLFTKRLKGKKREVWSSSTWTDFHYFSLNCRGHAQRFNKNELGACWCQFQWKCTKIFRSQYYSGMYNIELFFYFEDLSDLNVFFIVSYMHFKSFSFQAEPNFWLYKPWGACIFKSIRSCRIKILGVWNFALLLFFFSLICFKLSKIFYNWKIQLLISILCCCFRIRH